MVADNQPEFVDSRTGSQILGVKPAKFFYHFERGEIGIEPGTEQRRERRYKVADILQVKARLQQKKRRPEPVLIDWLYSEDLPAGLKLAHQVYKKEVDLAEAAVYQGWRRSNPQLTLAAFSKDRSVCFATLQVVPLDEQVILDVLSGRRMESSIKPDEVHSYSEPGAYTVLVTSATVLKGHPELLYKLLDRYMQFWLAMYPGRYMTRIYAQTVSESGVKLVQHFFMSPLYNIAHDAYMLDLARPSASKMIQKFKMMLTEKAPLPPDLHWPPPPPAPAAQPIAPEPPHVAPRPSRERTPHDQAPAPVDLPAGSLHIQNFLRTHHIEAHRRRITSYLDAGHGLQHIAVPKPNRPGESDRYLTPEQQTALLTWIQERHPDILTNQ